MNLRSPNPYWLVKNGLVASYPSLAMQACNTGKIKADIVIMGAGITGSLLAYHLQQAGHQVMVLDRRQVGMGRTVASTSLLQYEIDTPLHKLVKMVGKDCAFASYQWCGQSILDLQKISARFKGAADFELRPSIQFASFASHLKNLQEEFHLRKEAGFDVNWWNEGIIQKKLGFSRPGAICSLLGAELDAFKLTHLLLGYCMKQGATVYDQTSIVKIQHHSKSVELLTLEGKQITCRKLIIACGYESQKWLQKKVEILHATYAIAGKPLPERKLWYKRSLIWETANPYLYMRTTRDNRIIVGGLDDDAYNAGKRDRKIARKSMLLQQKFNGLFPEIPLDIDFEWAGHFAGTKDGLPYIGSVPERPDTFFALGFGGNGITFSEIAAQILTRELSGKRKPMDRMFSFSR